MNATTDKADTMRNALAPAASDRLVNELWWITMIEATLTLFFGISAVFWPGLTLLTLVYLFGGFVVALGIVQLFSGITSIRARSTWWITALLGILGIGVGVYLLRHTNVSLQTFLLLIGLLLVGRGLLDLVRVLTDRKSTQSAVPKTLTSIVSVSAIVAGIIIMVQPATGGIAFVWVLGLYAIVIGALNMAIAMELRTAMLGQAVQDKFYQLKTENTEDKGVVNEPRGRKRTGAQPA